MEEMTAFERQLAAEMRGMVGPMPRFDVAAIAGSAATTSPRWRFQSMFSATKFVVAGVIVALFGGFLLAGVLTQQPSDDGLPAVGASASAEASETVSAEPEATTPVEAADTTATPDLLWGVDLVTEEVEPGVHRVWSDGVRDLSRVPAVRGPYDSDILDGNIIAGLDGSVWWFGHDGFYRLGEEAVHRWPKRIISEDFRPGQTDVEVGPDGTVWLAEEVSAGIGGNRHVDISSYDGQAWSKRWQGAAGKRWALDVDVQQDGTVWMAWSTKSKGVRAARLVDDDWEVVSGMVEARESPYYGDVVVSDGGGSEVWLPTHAQLHRHDGEGWVIQPTPEVSLMSYIPGRYGNPPGVDLEERIVADADGGGVMRADAGPDGTLWVRLHPICGPDSGCGSPSDILARLDGEDWEVYDSSDGIPMMSDHYGGFEGFFEVAPDRSIWFNPQSDETAMLCDGVASFDGQVMTHHLRDLCIYAMDMAPDGNVWLQGGRWPSTDDPLSGPIHTYVITPEAVTAVE